MSARDFERLKPARRRVTVRCTDSTMFVMQYKANAGRPTISVYPPYFASPASDVLHSKIVQTEGHPFAMSPQLMTTTAPRTDRKQRGMPK